MAFKEDAPEQTASRFREDTPAWQQELSTKTRQAFTPDESGAIRGLYGDYEEEKPIEQRVGEVGAATGFGAGLGVVAPKVLKAIPYAPAKAIGSILERSPAAMRALGGAVTGATSETAGQTAEVLGAGRGTAEAARILGGGGAGIVERLASTIPGKLGVTYRAAKKFVGGAPDEATSEATRRAVQAFRGEGRTAEPATGLYEQMRGGLSAEQAAAQTGARRLASEAEDITRKSGAAGEEAARTAERWGQEARAELNRIGQPREATDVGIALRDRIKGVQGERLAQREAQFAADKQARDAAVAARESTGESMADLPGYKNILEELKGKLLIGKKAQEQTLRPVSEPGTLSAYNNIYEALVNKRVATALDEFGNPAEYKTFKNSFEAVDDVRRKLADVAFGKEVEGYKGISSNIAKDYWRKLSDLQIEFAGEPQRVLLQNYESGSGLLKPFKTARGEAATAMERFDPERYINDPAGLPKQYFSTRTGVDDLIELTGGDKALVNQAARSFVAKELEGKNAAQVAGWVQSKSDFLSNPAIADIKQAVKAYQSTLERAERGGKAMERAGAAQVKRGEATAAETMKGAEALVADAQQKASAILKSQTPAKLFSEMLTGADPVGNMKTVAQYVATDPAGQKLVERAVRQAVADVAPASIERQWVNGVRPAMEGSKLMSPEQLTRMDAEIKRIAESLNRNPRAAMKYYQSMIYNALLGETASLTGRGAVSGYNTLQGLTNPMGY